MHHRKISQKLVIRTEPKSRIAFYIGPDAYFRTIVIPSHLISSLVLVALTVGTAKATGEEKQTA